MTWQDRIRVAAYTSPSGVRIEFDFENVVKSFDKRTTAFNFPDADGTYIQDLGSSGRRYPMRVIFWGDDHDLQSIAFESLLNEVGIGTLEHPAYGVIKVVPFGTISFRSDLKTQANQTIIDVPFWESIDLIYPSSQSDPATDVLVAVDEYNQSAAESFDNSTDLDIAVEQATFKAETQSLLDNVKVGMQTAADAQDDVKKQFDTVYDSINNSIDILIGQPLALASQTVILIQSPARAASLITDRLNAYKDLANSITQQSPLVPGNDSTNANAFHVNDLYASTYVIGSIVSVINNQFVTKTDAIEAAEFIINQMDELTVWRDDNFTSLLEIDTGEAYQQLQEAVALATGFLISISFTLKQERCIFLESPRTIIDLIAELYPDDIIIDDEIDFFIQSNELTGSEIFEIPRGRKVVYYV